MASRYDQLLAAAERRARSLSRHPSRRDPKLAALMRAAARAGRQQAARKRSTVGQGPARWNPVSRARLAARVEKLHAAVGRSIGRRKRPSARAIAIEQAYGRAVRALERSRRENPVAKARRRKKGSSPKRRGSRGNRQASLPGVNGGRSRARRAPRVPTPAPKLTGFALMAQRAGIKPGGSSSTGPASGNIARAFGEFHHRTQVADAEYRRYKRSLAKRRKAYATKKRRKAAGRKAAATRARRPRVGRMPAALARYWAARRRKKGGSRRRKTTRMSSVRRWAQMSRGKRFTRKVRAAVHGYGRALKLRKRASITAKEHRSGLRSAEKAFRRQNPRRRRRNPSALIVNPRRRAPMRRRRRRNPGIAGVVMQVAKSAVPAVGTAAALGALDVKLASAFDDDPKKTRIVSTLIRLGVGVGALMALPNKPAIAVPIACAALAGIGQDLGTQIAGGIVGGSKKSTAKQMAALASEDAETLGVVLTEMQGFGVLQVQGMGSAADEAAAAFAGTDPIDAGVF